MWVWVPPSICPSSVQRREGLTQSFQTSPEPSTGVLVEHLGAEMVLRAHCTDRSLLEGPWDSKPIPFPLG